MTRCNPGSLQDADPAVMGPVLVQKLELFEKKKVARLRVGVKVGVRVGFRVRVRRR